MQTSRIKLDLPSDYEVIGYMTRPRFNFARYSRIAAARDRNMRDARSARDAGYELGVGAFVRIARHHNRNLIRARLGLSLLED